MTLDEDDLRLGLRALTYAPPPVPPRRAASSARRWRWIKTRRIAVATVTAFAVAVPVIALVRQPSAGEAHPAALQGWPDRRDPAYRDFADRLLQHPQSDVSYGRTAEWLYAGRVDGTEDTVVAVWALCDGSGCPDVVLEYGHLSGETQTEVVGRLPQRSGAPFGWYFKGTGGETVLFALGPTSADTLTYDGHEVRGHRGVFMASIGYVDHSPDVVMRDGHRVLYHGPLAVDTNAVAIAFATPAPPITALPAGSHVLATRHGQGSTQEMGPRPTEIAISAGTKFRLVARCVGHGRLVVFWTGTEPAIPCDGTVHEWPEYTAGRDLLLTGMNDTDPYAVWTYVVVVRS